jgi:hypothetical protein
MQAPEEPDATCKQVFATRVEQSRTLICNTVFDLQLQNFKIDLVKLLYISYTIDVLKYI